MPRKKYMGDMAALAVEYSKSKNSLPVNEVPIGSHMRVWWRCRKRRCRHEWQARVRDRVGRGDGCPACCGRVATARNNMAVTHPNLAKEYMAPPKNKLPASKVIAGSGKKFWWKCDICGWEWRTRGSTRTRKHWPAGCPNYIKHKT